MQVLTMTYLVRRRRPWSKTEEKDSRTPNNLIFQSLKKFNFVLFHHHHHNLFKTRLQPRWLMALVQNRRESTPRYLVQVPFDNCFGKDLPSKINANKAYLMWV